MVMCVLCSLGQYPAHSDLNSIHEGVARHEGPGAYLPSSTGTLYPFCRLLQ